MPNLENRPSNNFEKHEIPSLASLWGGCIDAKLGKQTEQEFRPT